MKKLILALLVMTTLVSCGKNNKVSGQPLGGASSPITINDVNGKSLGSLIDTYTTSFGTNRYSYYETVNQAIARSPNLLTYYYTNQTGTYNVCLIKCYTNITPSRVVNNAEVNIANKQSELKAIINSAHAQYPVMKLSATVFQITTTTGDIYLIDTLQPLQANPVYIQKYNSKPERLIEVKE